MVSRKEQLVEYILVQNIPAMYIERVEESFEESKTSFVVIDVDDDKVFALDRETTLSIQNSKNSLGMSLAPVGDMLINTTAKEVTVSKIEWTLPGGLYFLPACCRHLSRFFEVSFRMPAKIS